MKKSIVQKLLVSIAEASGESTSTLFLCEPKVPQSLIVKKNQKKETK